jgi:hypothetical protein
VKIDGDGPIFAGLVSGIAHGSPSGQMVGAIDDPRWGEDCTMARGSRRTSGLHHIIWWNVEFSAPLPNRLVGDDDATGEQELFHITVAETEPEIQPDTVADDLGGEAVVLRAVAG